MRIGIVAALGLALSSGASAATVITFSGSADGHAVSGSFSYDPAVRAEISFGKPEADAGIYLTGVLSFTSGATTRSSGYRTTMFNAQPGNALGLQDSFGAYVNTGRRGREAYSFVINWADANAISDSRLPAMPAQGPATFSYAFAGQGFSVPVSWSFEAAAVPEPKSWAIMFAGFAMLGGSARRRTPRRIARAD